MRSIDCLERLKKEEYSVIIGDTVAIRQAHALNMNGMKSSELKNSRKKHKEEVAITPETPVTEEPQTYCTCGEVEER